MNWFAQVNGQIYGPYNDAQMQSFVSEGRITSESLISNNPPEGFYAAMGYDIFSFWAGTGQAEQQAVGQTAPQSYRAEPAPQHLAYEQHHIIEPQIAEPDAQAITPARTQLTSFMNAPKNIVAQDANVQPHIFMIMAEIRSEGMMEFLQQVQGFGTAERVGDSVWLLKSSASAQALRNALSQALSRQDRMFIIDVSDNKTAWFNIGADLDSRIRAIWEE